MVSHVRYFAPVTAGALLAYPRGYEQEKQGLLFLGLSHAIHYSLAKSKLNQGLQYRGPLAGIGPRWEIFFFIIGQVGWYTSFIFVRSRSAGLLVVLLSVT